MLLGMAAKQAGRRAVSRLLDNVVVMRLVGRKAKKNRKLRNFSKCELFTLNAESLKMVRKIKSN